MASLREQKKAQTRAALARAAAEIARYEGPEKQNIAAISAKAGVSPRTFHNYFSSREEAILTFTVEATKELMDLVEELDCPTVFDAVEQATIIGLQRSEMDLKSFYSLGILSQHTKFMALKSSTGNSNQLRTALFERATKIFPDLDQFDLTAQIITAATAARFAVEYYFIYAHDGGSEAGIKIVRRAFDQFRDSPTADPVAFPDDPFEACAYCPPISTPPPDAR